MQKGLRFILIAGLIVLSSCDKKNDNTYPNKTLENKPMNKNYKLKASDIKRMIPDLGYAFTTDMITVEGKKVDYMYRETPDRKEDSGWRFFGGGETQDYVDNPGHTSLLALNTVANYDPDIIPFLTYPVGTKIERNPDGVLEVKSENVEKPNIIFLQPVDSGPVTIGDCWTFDIASRMTRRIEDDSIVIWRPGFTIWIDIYTTHVRTRKERFELINEIKPDLAYDIKQEEANGLLKLRYRYDKEEFVNKQPSICVFGLTDRDEIHMTVYFDSDVYLNEIEQIWNTLSNTDL